MKKIILLLFMIILTEKVFAVLPKKDIKCAYNVDKIERFNVSIFYKNLVSSKASSNLNYDFFIKDLNNFNLVDDYVIIRDKDGNKVIYSMICKNTVVL